MIISCINLKSDVETLSDDYTTFNQAIQRVDGLLQSHDLYLNRQDCESGTLDYKAGAPWVVYRIEGFDAPCSHLLRVDCKPTTGGVFVQFTFYPFSRIG